MNLPENVQAGLVNANAKIDAKAEIKAADSVHTHIGGTTNYDNSQNNQIFYMGMSYSDVLKIVNTELSLANAKLMKQIESRLLPEDINSVKGDFDFLDTYREAVKISAKRHDKTTDDVLSEIILERIKETDDFPKIVQNEAILTIGKLTKSQIDILHTIAMCHHAVLTFNDSKDLLMAMKEMVKPLFDNQFLDIDFNYLAYTGCITMMFTGHYEFYKVIQRMTRNQKNISFDKNSEDYKYMEQKWNNSLLRKSSLTTVGQYIGLHYHNVMFDKKLPNIEKLFINEEK